MKNVAIKVEGLGKKYLIQHEKKERYQTFRDTLLEEGKNLVSLLNPFQNNKNSNKLSQTEEFWALKDIDFEINQGDKVGIIGRNGAGKSTLLKILSRITEPTTGKIHINGRIASLLEVGTGFHPELTGRENIYLNGAILGMTRNEIKAKFDEIVAFSEVEKFLDTPVKRYSSGMYVRLAFAVAAHLEPEILVVDEVLAVGDVEFQKKCLGKMNDVSKEGRTILFVSHNMGAVGNLCQKGIMIESGSKVYDGSASDVINLYVSGGAENSFKNSVTKESIKNDINLGFELEKVEIFNPENKNILMGEPVAIRIKYKSTRKWISPAFVVSIKDFSGLELIRLSSMPISGYVIDDLYFNGIVELSILSLPLVSGQYVIDIGFVRESIEWVIKYEDIIKFEVQGKDVYNSGLILDRSRGIIAVEHVWKHQNDSIYE